MDNATNGINNGNLWSKDFAIIVFMSFLISLVLNMHGSTLSLFVLHLGGNKAILGVITSSVTISAFIFRPIFGNMLDTGKRKLVLLIGIIILSVISASYIFAFSVWMVLFLRFCHGIGHSAQSTSITTIIADMAPSTEVGKAIGYYSVSTTIATAAGPIIGLYLVQKHSYSFLYTVSFMISIIIFMCFLLINYKNSGKQYSSKPTIVELNTDTAKENINNTGEAARDNPALNHHVKIKNPSFFEKTALPPSIVMFFVMITFSSVFIFMSSYAASIGINKIGYFFVTYVTMFLASRAFTDKLSFRYDIYVSIIPGMIFMVISFLLIAYADSLIMFMIAGSFYGFGYGSTQPALNSLAIKFCSPDKIGSANATFFSSMDSGFFIGALIWGLISQKIGYEYIYIGSAISIIISLAVYICIMRTRRDVEEEGL